MISVVRRTMQKDEMPQRQCALLRRSVPAVIKENQGESLSVSNFLEIVKSVHFSLPLVQLDALGEDRQQSRCEAKKICMIQRWS